MPFEPNSRTRSTSDLRTSGIDERSEALEDPSFEALLRAAARVSDADTAALDPRLIPGGTLGAGRFQLLRRLGRGGMGIVFEAYDAERRAKVALKLLTGMRPDRVYRLKNEFRSLLDLRHENLVRLHELFADEGLWYFSMELVAGCPFDAYVRPAGVLDVARLDSCFRQLTSAVLAIHRAGKLHRDLKPSNVLVTSEGKVVVLDFGLVVDAELGGVGQTITDRAVCGTPAYMAPEQAAGRRPRSESDLYALGVMLFEALCGQLPFDGSAGEIIAAKQRDEPPQLADASLPKRLTALCATLLARDPAARESARSELVTLDDHAPALSSQIAQHQTLAGREDELAALEHALLASESGPLVVDLEASSGLGKSALCSALALRLRARGVTVIAGRCYERESVPYKAFDPLLDALSRILRKLPAAELAQLIPDGAGALTRLFPVLERVPALAPDVVSAGPSSEDRDRAFAAFGALLERLCTRGRLVLMLDDLQWADGDSLVFLQHLLKQVASPMLFVLSHRPAPSGSPLTRMLRLVRENRTLRVRPLALAPLSAQAVRALVSAREPALCTRPDVLDVVVQAAQGNPFVAARLAQVAASDGDAQLDLAAALRRHVGRVGAGAERLLAVVAMVSEPLLARAALEAANASHEDLERLLQERLVSVSTGGHAHGSGKVVECYHDIIRESVLAALGASDRVRYARRFAEVLATLDEPTAELQRRCLLHAGEYEKARRLTVALAERAAGALAFERAAELYQQALEGGELDVSERKSLLGRAAETLVHAGRASDAARLYSALAALSDGEDSLVYLKLAATHLLGAGHYTEGWPLLARVCERLGVAVPTSNVRSLAAFTWSEARLRARGLALRGERSPDSTLRLEAAHILSASALNYGALQGAAACANYLRLALDAGDPQQLALALGLNAILHSRNPRGFERAQQLVARLEQIMEAEAPALHGYLHFVRGAVACNARRFADARDELTRALVLYRDSQGPYVARDVTRMYLQIAAHGLGDFAQLARETPAAIDDAYQRGRIYIGVMLSGPNGAGGWLLHDDPDALEHRLDEARRRWRSAGRPQLPDFALLGSEIWLKLYRGEPEHALDLLDSNVPALRRSLGPLYARAISGPCTVWYGLCAGAALRDKARVRGRDELRGLIHASITSLRRDPRFVFAAQKLEAVCALERGDLATAIDKLREPVMSAQHQTLGLFQAAHQIRLGQLLGGDIGREHVRAGESAMRSQGAVDVERFSEWLFPGLRPH
jgi:eukaryotic-like serine/threonine-protein kinase